MLREWDGWMFKYESGSYKLYLGREPFESNHGTHYFATLRVIRVSDDRDCLYEL